MTSNRLRPALLAIVSYVVAACAGTLQPSHQNPGAYTNLDAAVEGCDLVKTKQIIGTNRTLLNERGWSGTTPLYLAALNSCVEVARFLLAQDVDVNAKSEQGATALHVAAQRGDLEMVKLLLAHHADINAVDSKNRTAKDRALQWHHADIAEYLKKARGR